MKLDISYVEDRNLWIDIKLIFKTVLVLFGDKNASQGGRGVNYVMCFNYGWW